MAELASAATSQPLADQTPSAASDSDAEWTPVQRWFQELDLPQPHHFNQSVLLELDEALDLEHARLAIEALVHQHPALRTCFRKKEKGWKKQQCPTSKWT
ncbi:MAG TPA: hypothetical protein EYQ31_13285, partial [Candidatus Handelsmanbacteria bacterium]|nr:hypothetical protein [Candidatus Handelsmanbacteria bacterium]